MRPLRFVGRGGQNHRTFRACLCLTTGSGPDHTEFEAAFLEEMKAIEESLVEVGFRPQLAEWQSGTKIDSALNTWAKAINV